jgi:hypothetical protein
MKKSEKILAGVTAVVLVGYVLLTFTGESEEVDTGVSSDQLRSLRSEYEELIEKIELADSISREYFSLVGQGSAPEKRTEGVAFRPDIDFLDQVKVWCTEAGFPNTKFSSKTDPIKDVDDYRLVNVTVDIDRGQLANVAALVKKFEANGLIIQQVRLESPVDRAEIGAEIVVGKIVENYIRG